MFRQTLCRSGIDSNDVGACRLEVFDAGHELTHLPGAIRTLVSGKPTQHQKNDGSLFHHRGEFDLRTGHRFEFKIPGLAADGGPGSRGSLAWFRKSAQCDGDSEKERNNEAGRHSETS
jgi:hypothetical protein